MLGKTSNSDKGDRPDDGDDGELFETAITGVDGRTADTGLLPTGTDGGGGGGGGGGGTTHSRHRCLIAGTGVMMIGDAGGLLMASTVTGATGLFISGAVIDESALECIGDSAVIGAPSLSSSL